MRAEMPIPEGDATGFQALARDPTPDEVVLLAELVEGLLRRLSERDRAVVSLALQGYAPPEVGAETGVPERTVYRVLERVRQRLRTDDSQEESLNPSPPE